MPKEATTMSDKSAMSKGGHLYMQTNEIENAIIHYQRVANGILTEVERVPTRGAGSGKFKPISGQESAPNAFEGAGSIIVTPDRHFLFTTNGGDNSVSSFRIGDDGRLTLVDVKATGNPVEGRSGTAKSLAYSPQTRTLFVLHSFGPDHLRLMSVDQGKLTPRPERYTVNTHDKPNRDGAAATAPVVTAVPFTFSPCETGALIRRLRTPRRRAQLCHHLRQARGHVDQPKLTARGPLHGNAARQTQGSVHAVDDRAVDHEADRLRLATGHALNDATFTCILDRDCVRHLGAVALPDRFAGPLDREDTPHRAVVEIDRRDSTKHVEGAVAALVGEGTDLGGTGCRCPSGRSRRCRGARQIRRATRPPKQRLGP